MSLLLELSNALNALWEDLEWRHLSLPLQLTERRRQLAPTTGRTTGRLRTIPAIASEKDRL